MSLCIDFQARRNEVFKLMPDNSIALLRATPQLHRNNDTEYPYRQESYFYYLTGFEESVGIAALVKKGGKNEYILFCQDRDPGAEQWTGPRAGCQGAIEKYGAHQAYPISGENLSFPDDFFLDVDTVYYLINLDPAFDKKIFSWLDFLSTKHRSAKLPHQFVDLRTLLDEMRLIKTPQEVNLIRRACAISSAAHIHAMEQCQVGMKEYELEAILLHDFTKNGSRSPAYPCIVASGSNACILHYTRNNVVIKGSDLVLIDAGAEYEYYAADITRTFPANGTFSKAACAIYELVLAAQMAAIEHAKPGVLWQDMQQIILNILVTGLVDLKILKGDPQSLIAQKAYVPFYMHNSGHWLGMDVHDVGDYQIKRQWRTLMPGMVFTVEPGLYFGEHLAHVDEPWRGIGVRIEDDILITRHGAEVLSQAPKTIHDIEKLMK